MNRRARPRGAFEVHGQQEIPGQEITPECTEVHAAEVHAPGPLFRGGGHLEDWEKRLQDAAAEWRRKQEVRRKEREEFKTRRDFGLAARHRNKLRRNEEDAMTRNQCRYLTRHENRCTREPVDTSEQAEVLLCLRHLGSAMELLKARGFTVTPPKEN